MRWGFALDPLGLLCPEEWQLVMNACIKGVLLFWLVRGPTIQGTAVNAHSYVSFITVTQRLA